MALYSKTQDKIEPTPKKTSQGSGAHTKYSATSRIRHVNRTEVKGRDELQQYVEQGSRTLDNTLQKR